MAWGIILGNLINSFLLIRTIGEEDTDHPDIELPDDEDIKKGV